MDSRFAEKSWEIAFVVGLLLLRLNKLMNSLATDTTAR